MSKTNVLTVADVGRKIVIFGLYVFAVSVMSTISGLNLGVAMVSLGALIVLAFGKRFLVIHPGKELSVLAKLSAAFLVVALLSSLIFSPNVFNSIKRFNAILGFFGLLLGVLTVEDDSKIRRVLDVIVVVCIIESVLAALQYFFKLDLQGREEVRKYGRVMGTMSCPNDLGIAFGIFLPFIVAMFWDEKETRKKIFYAAGTLMTFCGLLFAATRGAWIGGFLGITAMSFLRDKRVFFGVIVVTVITLSLPFVRQRLKDTTIQKEQERVDMLTRTPQFVLQRLFLGWGLDSFLTLYYDKYPSDNGNRHFHPHNTYVNIALQTGFIGLALYLAMLGTAFWYCFRFYGSASGFAKTALWGCIGSLIDYCVHSFVDEPFRAYHGPYVMFFLLAVVFLFAEQKKQNNLIIP